MGIGICTGKMGFSCWDWDLSEKKSQNGNGIACVQTSPLPQEKSGEETSVNRRR